MKIQKILFPDEKYCSDDEMYFRAMGEKPFDRLSRSIKLNKDNIISFNTYFNSFSIGKWREYTYLSNLSLTLKYRGDLEITAYNSIGRIKDAGKYDIYKKELSGESYYAKRKEIRKKIKKEREGGFDILRIGFPELPVEGTIYIKLKAREDSIIYGGDYETEPEKNPAKSAGSITLPRSIRLALCICTFKREEELKRNLDALKKEILLNQNSPVYRRVDIFISDNGKTLTGDHSLDSGEIKVFQNKNAGGAGGFTRAMTEAMGYTRSDKEKGHKYSHLILMDDDIILNPEIIIRTFNFLSLIKEHYKNSMVGAHMLSLENRSMLYEAGAKRSGTKLSFPKRGWDLKDPAAVSANETSRVFSEANTGINYSGWWYSVIPAGIITEKNLPMPVFINFDDIEYGLRNRKNGAILLNGICVWHPQGVGKASPGMTYYHVRNIFITMCADPDRAGTVDALKYAVFYVLGNLALKKYEEAEASLLALSDFLEGPEFFLKLDPEEKHKEIMRFSKRKKPDPKRIFSIFFSLIPEILKIFKKYEGTQEAYKNRKNEMTSFDFWKEYLSI